MRKKKDDAGHDCCRETSIDRSNTACNLIKRHYDLQAEERQTSQSVRNKEKARNVTIHADKGRQKGSKELGR